MLLVPAGLWPCVVTTSHSPSQKSNCLYSGWWAQGCAAVSALSTTFLNSASSRSEAKSASCWNNAGCAKPASTARLSNPIASSFLFNLAHEAASRYRAEGPNCGSSSICLYASTALAYCSSLWREMPNLSHASAFAGCVCVMAANVSAAVFQSLAEYAWLACSMVGVAAEVPCACTATARVMTDMNRSTTLRIPLLLNVALSNAYFC